jgi:pimeloyl-ACP methyl ester carboxylesterase
MGTMGVAPSRTLLERISARERELASRGEDVALPEPRGAIPQDGRIAHEGLRTKPPRENGGNLDVKQLVAGSRVLFPVWTEGALFSALTMRGVQRERPSLYDLTDELRALEVPTLLMVGDEDAGCLETNLMLKRTIPSAALVVLPRSGHTLNLEEPASFNRLVAEFLATVDAGRWRLRDPRSVSESLTGISG